MWHIVVWGMEQGVLERGEVQTMAKLEQLETEITSLPEEEYRQFREWFLKVDWERWDKEIEEDSRTGKLDFLMQEALDAKKAKKLRDL